MGVVYIFLLIQGITGSMDLYKPQNIVSVDVNGSAVITCLSSKGLDTKNKISWYHRKWRSREELVRVKSCTMDNDPHKYVCNHEKYRTSLQIHNVQTKDSGVYYCVHLYSINSREFGNGTNLHVGDKSTSRSSIHILSHLQTLHTNSSLHLTCVILGPHNTVHLYWNISGTYHRGRIISKEESDGTWTVMNVISLPQDNWNYGEKVTCEAWIQSSPLRVHWEFPNKGESHGYFTSKCQNFLIPVVTAGTLLVLTLSIHLLRTIKFSDNKTHKDPVTQDEIVYSKLDINHLNKLKKQHRQ